MIFEKAIQDDIDAVGILYCTVCDYLSTHINYPGGINIFILQKQMLNRVWMREHCTSAKEMTKTRLSGLLC